MVVTCRLSFESHVITLTSGQSCGIQIDVRFGTNIYLDISEVDTILYKVADELRNSLQLECSDHCTAI